MQTKNINVDRQPPPANNNNSANLQEKMVFNSPTLEDILRSVEGVHVVPPIPPRTIVFNNSSAKNENEIFIEGEGYGPYKPVPPPKPLPQQPVASQSSANRSTPPPYRMPPYPLYNEPSGNIPGSAGGLDNNPMAASNPQQGQQGLQTHSSKFPIEREVILSSSDKNSKIPILHDYMKRAKATIAPDLPPKQMSAWTQGQGPPQQVLSPDQTHPNAFQSQQQSDPAGVFRATYHNAQDYYNSSSHATGAVPRNWSTEATQKPRTYHEEYSNNQTDAKENLAKDGAKGGKTMTKTYHTIKDIISSKFSNGAKKDADVEKNEEGLNNEMKKEDEDKKPQQKKTAGEQGIYGKPQSISLQQHQYNQQIIQQQIMAQGSVQNQNSHLQMQQQNFQQHPLQYQQQYQLMQARSTEMLMASRQEEMFYQAYTSSPKRPGQRFVQGQPQPNERSVDRLLMEQRSPQQIERDNLRQKINFEARRAASHPQLAYDDEAKSEIPDNRPQPQIQVSQRRGSHGNIMEASQSKPNPTETEKDSDDGGFLKRDKENKKENEENTTENNDSKVNSILTGTPRKRLETEIGKIEGVYNVGARNKVQENAKKLPFESGASSDYDKPGQSSSNADSGRGSAAYSSGRRAPVDTSNESSEPHHQLQRENYQNHDPEWVDIVENELRHILEPKLHELSLSHNPGIANSTLSESMSSMTPPLPPLSPGEQSSPNVTPRNSTRYKHSSLPYGSKPDYDNYGKTKNVPRDSRWHGGGSQQKHRSGKKFDHSAMMRSKQVFGLDTTDLTSTTTRSMDLESMLDGQSDSEGDISTTDARAIRKQLEGLENMYSEVLKFLGVKNKAGRYQPSDPRFSKRRYGSMSSLPSSSVSSRPIRDKRRGHEERKKVRDMRGINKRFQRLESHVVTLARSVAHLSSEMRTQHLMIQEMENIRGEIAALRTQTNILNVRSQSASRPVNTSKDLPNLANPTRVKKLTKFFGDEPPLLRLFLRKLGYEKYANVFENERVGMVELPYLSEERLQKMGVPLGPRLRIMQEAQISVCKENTLCIV